ncbi:MAG TPA: DUF3854 domain-containing protein [Thermomicrobiales bacterium]
MTATPILLDHHRAQLDASAIGATEITQRGYFSAQRIIDVKRYGFGEAQCNVPALVIPIYGPDGQIVLYQSRPDTPRLNPKTGKPVKYETPSKARMALDIPPRARRYVGDPTTPMLLTEGVKKADSAVSNGFPFAVALLGVWNWLGTNDDGGKVALAEFDQIALNSREVDLVFDSDVMQKPSVYAALRRIAGFLQYKGARVRFIYLSAGPDGAKVGLDDYLAAGHTPKDVLALAEDDLRPLPADEARDGERIVGAYKETANGILWLRDTRDGRVETMLTNFPARIVGNVAEDDGAEVRRVLEVRATLKGRPRTARLTPEKFVAMGWPIELLGAGALVYPGQSAKDHTRAAIQLLSGDVTERIVYAHSGWREHDGQMVYLHGGGALGADGPVAGVEVALPGDLARIDLPAPPIGADLIAAVRASLNVISTAPEALTIPLLAATYRAALGGTDFSLFLVGPTGIGKSELAALVQQHYGLTLDARHLPASWSSTANALEGLLFAGKDALVTIDDFAPGGNQADVQRIHRDAERVLRGQGNHAGRQRMTADARLRTAKPSRALPLITGEDVARGQSARARALILEVGPGDVRWPRLADAQRAAADGIYAASLAGFLMWVAPQYATIQATLAAETLRLRELATASDAHRRTPGIVASLGAAWRLFLDYAVESGALSAAWATKSWERGWLALGQAANAQAKHQTASEPTARFLELLGSALGSGKAHVAAPNGGTPDEPKTWGWRSVVIGTGEFTRQEWRPQGTRIGWVEGDDLYLDRDAALAEVQRLGREVGDGLAVTAAVLTKRLHEKGLLASTDEARETLPVRRTLEGKRRAVLHLAAAILAPTETTEEGAGTADDQVVAA